MHCFLTLNIQTSHIFHPFQLSPSDWRATNILNLPLSSPWLYIYIYIYLRVLQMALVHVNSSNDMSDQNQEEIMVHMN